jgi:hypothetical protein
MTGTIIYWDETYHNGRIAEDQSGAFLYHFSNNDFEDGRMVPALGDRVSFFRGRDKLKIAKGKTFRTAVKVQLLTTEEPFEIPETEVLSDGDAYSFESQV